MSVAVPVIDFIDGPNRRIHLKIGASVWHPVDDIYAEVRQMRRLDEDLRKYDVFCKALALVEKEPNKFTGRALILLGGTRIIPADEDAEKVITGELLSDEGISGIELIDVSTLSPTTKIKISYAPPPATEIVLVEGGSSDILLDLVREVLDDMATHADATIINEGVKKSSLLIPHTGDLPVTQ